MITALVVAWTVAQCAFTAASFFCLAGWVAGLARIGTWHEAPWFARLSAVVTALWLVVDLWDESWIRAGVDLALIVFWVGQSNDAVAKRRRAKHYQEVQ